MVDRAPAVSISATRATPGLTDLKRSLVGIEQDLRDLAQAAKAASAAINAIKPPAATRAPSGGGGRSSATSEQRAAKRAQDEGDRLDRQISRQRQRSATGDARIVGATEDAAYRRHRNRMRAGDQALNAKFAARFGGPSGAHGGATRAAESARSGMLYRAVNAAGWAPGIPSEVYMTQMALGEMGLGLSLPLVAGGMGLVGLGMAGLGLNAALVDQSRTGEQMAAALGTTPTLTTGGGVAQQLDTLARQSHLTGDQTQQIAGGLTAGGLTRDQAMGQAFSQTAALVNVFGMSVKDATDLVTKQYTDLGRTTLEVTNLLQGMANVAQSTGIPASGIAAVLAGSPDLAANVGASQAAAAAAIFKGVYGDNQQATDMANLANIHGTGAYAVAGMLNMGVGQLDQLRGSEQGQGQIVDLLDAKARALSAGPGGPEAGFAAFNAFLQNAGGQALSWDAFQRALAAAPNAGALAAAPHTIFDTYGPQGANTGLALTGAGNLPGGARAANPWNLKDTVLNAAQGELAKAGDAAQRVAAGGPGGWAAVGGVAKDVALALPTMDLNIAKVMLGAENAGLGAAYNGINGAVGGAASALGATVNHVLQLTVDVRQNGQTIGTKKVTTPLPNGNQAYGQYTPPSPTPGR